jgi:hypothetical protein
LFLIEGNNLWLFSSYVLDVRQKRGRRPWQRWQVNQLDTEHQTALMWAAAFGHSSVVQGLIGRDAKVGQRSVQGSLKPCRKTTGNNEL